jgi:hypothetical protein
VVPNRVEPDTRTRQDAVTGEDRGLPAPFGVREPQRRPKAVPAFLELRGLADRRRVGVVLREGLDPAGAFLDRARKRVAHFEGRCEGAISRSRLINSCLCQPATCPRAPIEAATSSAVIRVLLKPGGILCEPCGACPAPNGAPPRRAPASNVRSSFLLASTRRAGAETFAPFDRATRSTAGSFAGTGWVPTRHGRPRRRP